MENGSVMTELLDWFGLQDASENGFDDMVNDIDPMEATNASNGFNGPIVDYIDPSPIADAVGSKDPIADAMCFNGPMMDIFHNVSSMHLLHNVSINQASKLTSKQD